MGKKSKSKNKAKKSKSKSKNKSKPVVEEEEVVVEEEQVEIELQSEHSDLDESDDDEVNEVTEIKQTKQKETVLDLVSKLALLETENSSLIEDIDNFLKQVKDLRQKLKKNSNEKKKILGKIPKIYEKEISKASKKKRKKQNTQSGILAPKPVPSPLINYLGLDEDAVLTRPAVIGKLHAKFKEKGLSSGHDTILDKEAAKILGGEDGQVINMLTNFQKFVKNIYDNN